MTKSVVLAAIALAAMTAATPVAAVTYLYSFTTVAGVTGDGTLTTAGPGTSAITSVTGVFAGSAVTGVSGYAGSDNILDPAGPYFSLGGFSVSTASGVDYNWYYDGAYHLIDSVTSPGGYENPSDMTVASVTEIASVPEPGTWGLMIAGFVMTGYAARRRRNVVAA